MKSYDEQDLDIVQVGIDFVRRLADRLMSCLLCLGALPAQINRYPPWWVVSSAKDWLADEARPGVEDVFSKIVPFPEGGANAYRPEILLAAFANHVVTSSAAGVRWLKGEDQSPLPEKLDLSRPDGGRIVAFSIRPGADKDAEVPRVRPKRLDNEAALMNELLAGKSVKVVRRIRESELLIEFEDGTRLYVDRSPSGLDLSITGGPDAGEEFD